MSARRATVRALLVLALAMQATWVLVDPDLTALAQTGPVGVGTLALLTLGTLALAAGILRPSHAARVSVADVCLGASALALLALAGPADSGPAVASLAVLGAGVAGLLLGTRAAAVAIVALAAGVSAPVLDALDVQVAQHGLGLPVYVASLGVASVFARAVALVSAVGADRAEAERDSVDRDRVAAEELQARLRDFQRLLHETVLNTLVAVGRGGLTASAELRALLPARAEEALAVLAGLGMPVSGAQRDRAQAHDLGPVLDQLRASGVEVQVRWVDLSGVPERVRTAVVGAAREALSNVARHAQASSVQVLCAVDGGRRVLLEVRDDGIGFDGFSRRHGLGIDDAVVQAAADVGGRAWVESSPGTGTAVYLAWNQAAPGAAAADDEPFAFVPAAGAVAMFVMLATAVSWMQFGGPPLTWSAVALMVALGMLAYLIGYEAPVPGLMVLVVAALGPLLGALERAGGGDLSGAWSHAAIAALFAIVAAMGPAWAWVVLLGSWLLSEAETGMTGVQPAAAAIVFGALVGLVWRRSRRAATRARAQRVEAEAARRVGLEHLARVLQRYAPLAESHAGELLAGLADGSVDPDDPGVRAWAAVEEQYIRTVVALDPDAGPLSRFTLDLAGRALRRGVRLHVEIPASVAVLLWDPSGAGESLRSVVAVARPGSDAKLSVRQEGQFLVVRLLAEVPVADQAALQSLPVAPVRTRPDVVDDEAVLCQSRQVVLA